MREDKSSKQDSAETTLLKFVTGTSHTDPKDLKLDSMTDSDSDIDQDQNYSDMSDPVHDTEILQSLFYYKNEVGYSKEIASVFFKYF